MYDQDYYNGLITSQYQNSPDFQAWVAALIDTVNDISHVAEIMDAAFDLDYAKGDQLDIIGDIVGRSRYIKVPIAGIFFSFNDTTITGWSAGIWKNPNNKTTQLKSLPDDAYRLLLKAKIAANNWDGTIPGIYAIWEALFGQIGTVLFIQDNQDMSMVIGIAGIQLDALTYQLLIQGYLNIKPAGVRIDHYVYSINNGPIFAFNTTNLNNNALAGWDSGSWGKEVNPI